MGSARGHAARRRDGEVGHGWRRREAPAAVSRPTTRATSHERAAAAEAPTDAVRAEQGRKLAPKFEALEQAVAAERISIDAQGFNSRPEHVVVFELERGNVSKLFEAARQGPVEWLLDAERPTDEDEDASEDGGDGAPQ